MARKSNPTVHQLGLSANAHKRLESRRATPKAARKEVEKAEAFIAEAAGEAVAKADGTVEVTTEPVEAPKSTRKPRGKVEYTFTAEDIRAARSEGSGRSWADIAKLLGLPNPGAARKAWAELTGTSHTEAPALVGRATKGARSSARLVTPKWDANADGDSVIAALEGAHIVVKSTLYGNETTEDLNVAFVTEYDESGDEPTVTFIEGMLHKGKDGENLLDGKHSTGATRTIAVSRIVEVR
jgi:hypothetical protein